MFEVVYTLKATPASSYWPNHSILEQASASDE